MPPNRQTNPDADARLERELAGLRAEYERLRDDKGVYLLPDGRINVAGLNAQNTAPFAKAFAETR